MKKLFSVFISLIFLMSFGSISLTSKAQSYYEDSYYQPYQPNTTTQQDSLYYYDENYNYEPIPEPEIHVNINFGFGYGYTPWYTPYTWYAPTYWYSPYYYNWYTP